MGATVFVAKESDPLESRVAASPETVKKMTALGLNVVVQKGAGERSRIADADFEAAGAKTGTAAEAKKADIMLRVRRPSSAECKSLKSGAIVLAQMDPYGNEKALAELAKAGVTSFAMELMPRITRAQSMDVLRTQANLAGGTRPSYRQRRTPGFDRAICRMMKTAAGQPLAARKGVRQWCARRRRLSPWQSPPHAVGVCRVFGDRCAPAAKEPGSALGPSSCRGSDDEFWLPRHPIGFYA